MNPETDYVKQFVYTWLHHQGYTADNCRVDDFADWYVENYPEGDKSIPDAFYAGNWRTHDRFGKPLCKHGLPFCVPCGDPPKM